MLRPPPTSTLFPYTTLFRSVCRSTACSALCARCVRPSFILVMRASGSCGFTHSWRSEEHTSELQSLRHLVCRLLLEKKKERNILDCEKLAAPRNGLPEADSV